MIKLKYKLTQPPSVAFGACQKICVNEIYHQNGTRSFPNSMAS